MLSPIIKKNYIAFDLSKRWEDTLVHIVYMAQRVCQEITDIFYKQRYAQIDVHLEQGAFLLGKPNTTSDGQYDVVLEELILVDTDHQSLTQFEFGQKAWTKLDQVLTANPELVLIGWFHTHPGHGIYLSQSDIAIAEGLFTKPYQIAMVIDNLDKTASYDDWGLFSLKKNKTINNSMLPPMPS